MSRRWRSAHPSLPQAESLSLTSILASDGSEQYHDRLSTASVLSCCESDVDRTFDSDNDSDNSTNTLYSAHDTDYDSEDDSWSVEDEWIAEEIMEYRESRGRIYHSYGRRMPKTPWSIAGLLNDLLPISGPLYFEMSEDDKRREQQELRSVDPVALSRTSRIANPLLDSSHHLWTLLLKDQFYSAPIQKPEKCLDVGTGSGIWIADVADRNPTATVKGIDIVPAKIEWLPGNARFGLDDFNEEWDIASQYDLVHARDLQCSVSDWPWFFSQCFKALRPGGWVDCCEADLDIQKALHQRDEEILGSSWAASPKNVGGQPGMSFNVASKFNNWLVNAGFVNIFEQRIAVPIGAWPEDVRQKNLGVLNQSRLKKGMNELVAKIANSGGEASTPESTG
ncbi:hypothetical protein BP6252_12750 [Coleophoma cylindrospora]|uniref:Uncharacterized protein n=1 Tax=Coleophoma cylindrospora TaxID=1849047 RepID=A0A3D8QCT7_9HELO|nr:hypothetical protein BP6252_12750 [Coleophoma cylindrospora]